MIYVLATSASQPETWLRGLLFGINESIYKFISQIYTFMLELAQTGNLMIENTTISDVTSRIYGLIGIVMLFRLGMVLLQYIADPDKTMDKNGSGSKIITKVITVLALLVLVPTMFSWLYRFQEALFTSNFLTNFFREASHSTRTLTPGQNYIYDDSQYISNVPKNKNDLVCMYDLDSSTNTTCLQMPGRDVTSIKLSSYYYLDDVYNFCPSRIIINKTQEKTYLKNSENNKYIELESDLIETKNIYSEKNSCSKISGVFNPKEFYGIQFLLPAQLEDYEAVQQNERFGGIVLRNISVTPNSKVQLKIIPVSETKSDNNPANYKLNTSLSTGGINNLNGKKLTDVYKLSHPFAMTADINSIVNSASVENDIKGTLFSDIIMMSFIMPNNGLSQADYDLYEIEKNKFELSSDEYKLEENQVKYSVLSALIKRTYTNSDGKFYSFEYSGIISLIAGIIVLIMLVATVFKVALRLFKLVVLEIMAPIPIVLYLDPNEKSAGGGSLSKWLNAVILTFIDIFIRVLVILFISMFISDISSFIETTSSTNFDNNLFKLFLIFGALMFINVGPEFILGLFGKKYEKGGFNPFAQMKEITGLGLASGIVGGGIKGLSQGGIKGAAAGLYLGGKASLSAGDKAKGLTGYAIGRDFTGKSLSDGPDSSGGFLQRFAQNEAASSLRAKANNLYLSANRYKEENLNKSKKEFATADNAYKEVLAMKNNDKINLEVLSNQVSTQGYTATSEQQSLSQKLYQNIHGYDVELGVRLKTRNDAADRFNSNRDEFERQFIEYKNAINEVNQKTGKAQTKFIQEQIDPNFKVPDRIDKI